jgi:hypothetical protein
LPSAILEYLISRGVWPKGPTAVRERVKETTAEKKSLQVHACISWTKAILLILFSIINYIVMA